MLIHLERPEMAPEFAISIRQPWAELILRGWKLTEYRSWRIPEKDWGEWLYLHVPADMNKWERSLTRKRVGTFAPILGGYVGCVRFGCPTREFTPIDAYEYIDWPCCWHWPVTGAERIPFIPAKGNLRIFKVR